MRRRWQHRLWSVRLLETVALLVPRHVAEKVTLDALAQIQNLRSRPLIHLKSLSSIGWLAIYTFREIIGR